MSSRQSAFRPEKTRVKVMWAFAANPSKYLLNFNICFKSLMEKIKAATRDVL